jgi:sulfatase-like protein
LDRLRNEAIYADNAYPPSDTTLVSMPAFITGNLISNAELISQSKLMITFADSKTPVPWPNQPNLFSKARESEHNTALVGWYIPYCSLIGASLTRCSCFDYEATTFSESMSKQLQSLVVAIPLASGFVLQHQVEAKEQYARRKQFQDYSSVFEVAKKVVTDPGLGLVMLHWPVPHLPGIYNRRENRFELSVESSYLDNLQLVDRTLGELRRDMEQAGIWDSTIVLVTSDHWLRSVWKTIGPESDPANQIIPSDADQRVPFLLKLPGQKHSVTYESVFNTVSAHDLVLALLRSEISDTDGVVHWLDQHRSIGKSPYLLTCPSGTSVD